MRRLLSNITLALFGVGALARDGAAQSILFQTGTAYDAASVSNFDATGLSMAGMRVSWGLADASDFEAFWGDLGGGSCGVDLGGFRLTLACDAGTFLASWRLQNNTGLALTSFTLNGALGRTMFDCGWLGAACVENGGAIGTGTPGTSTGFSFTKTGGSYAQSGIGVYSNVVGIGGAAPVGDLFEQFRLSVDGLASGTDYEFRMDADNTTANAPPPTVVPEPQTFVLLSAGLCVLGIGARRRSRAARWRAEEGANFW